MLIGCGVMNSTIVVLIVFISLFLFICACGMLKKIFGEECISDYCNISVIVLYGNENIKLKDTVNKKVLPGQPVSCLCIFKLF